MELYKLIFPWRVYKSSHFSLFSSQIFFVFFIVVILTRVRLYNVIFWICISLRNSDGNFSCSYCTSSFEKCLLGLYLSFNWIICFVVLFIFERESDITKSLNSIKSWTPNHTPTPGNWWSLQELGLFWNLQRAVLYNEQKLSHS